MLRAVDGVADVTWLDAAGNVVIYDVTDATNYAVSARFEPRRYVVLCLLKSDSTASQRYVIDIRSVTLMHAYQFCYLCRKE